MSWIDCKHRLPTAEDANKHGDVFWLRDAEHTFSGIWNARACDLVAWMPISEFVPEPEPQYRPFKNAEEFRPYQHLWWKVRGESRHYPQRAYDDEGTLNTWKYMFEHCEFQDGEPFGVRIGGEE